MAFGVNNVTRRPSSGSSYHSPSMNSHNNNNNNNGSSNNATVKGPERSRWRQRHPTGTRMFGTTHESTKMFVCCFGIIVISAVLFSAVYVVRPYLLVGGDQYFDHDGSGSSSNIGGLLSIPNIYRKRTHNIHKNGHRHPISDMVSKDHDPQQRNEHEDHHELRGASSTLTLDRFGLQQNQQQQGVVSEGLEAFRQQKPLIDAIVIGSGLAGMAATLHMLDRGGRVILVEKEPTLGGNSNKASSGINACCLPEDQHFNTSDTLESFRDDTIRSAGDVAHYQLIDTLVGHSASAVTWLKSRVGVDLSQLVQLGGHSHKRTHRPSEGFVGAEIISALTEALESYEKHRKDNFQLLTNTRVTKIIQDDKTGQVLGVECQMQHERKPVRIRSDHVVLATGGFASDRTHGSYLEKYRPELMNMPATAGPFSTGDGIALATALGAGLRDMEKIQIHPTGWVDPVDRGNPNKVLAAELLRGVGGILVNQEGRRFCNELGTRAYIADRMFTTENQRYAETKKWDPKAPVPTFYLILSDEAAQEGNKHVALYTHKGLMKTIHGIDALENKINIPKATLRQTFNSYRDAAKQGTDEFGKSVYRNVFREDLENEIFHVGEVIPVLHYCMGGITIDTQGNVLNENGEIILGLYAAGEVSGGVHGNNRLGGNSLLECAVFGTVVGQQIPVKEEGMHVPLHHLQQKAWDGEGTIGNNPQDSDAFKEGLSYIAPEEMDKHSTPNDCWVAVHGVVYDLTSFVPIHPGKAQPILNFAGKDATEIFDAVHSANVLSRMQKDAVGLWDKNNNKEKQKPVILKHDVRLEELKQHNDAEDCWVALHGKVYDLTAFAKMHPGGDYIITKFAGRDATESFQGFHGTDRLVNIQNVEIGPFLSDA